MFKKDTRKSLSTQYKKCFRNSAVFVVFFLFLRGISSVLHEKARKKSWKSEIYEVSADYGSEKMFRGMKNCITTFHIFSTSILPMIYNRITFNLRFVADVLYCCETIATYKRCLWPRCAYISKVNRPGDKRIIGFFHFFIFYVRSSWKIIKDSLRNRFWTFFPW